MSTFSISTSRMQTSLERTLQVQISLGPIFFMPISANLKGGPRGDGGAIYGWGQSEGAIFTRASGLQTAKFSGNLQGVNFSRCDLAGVNFQKFNLSDANLTGANLSGANLVDSNFANSTVSSVVLDRHTRLDQAIISREFFGIAKSSRCSLNDTQVYDARSSSSSLRY